VAQPTTRRHNSAAVRAIDTAIHTFKENVANVLVSLDVGQQHRETNGHVLPVLSRLPKLQAASGGNADDFRVQLSVPTRLSRISNKESASCVRRNGQLGGEAIGLVEPRVIVLLQLRQTSIQNISVEN
jgi:hypothetical protein